MVVKEVLGALDRLYRKDRAAVEEYLLRSIEAADREDDQAALATLLNEGIGFYRDRSRFGECKVCCLKAKEVMQRMGMQGTIPYATTLLNIATAYRAFGIFDETEEMYREVEDIYRRMLPSDDYLFATLYNNRGLLRQRQGRFGEAAEEYIRALGILEGYPDALDELATSEVNLASVLLETKEWKSALPHLRKAFSIYLDGRTGDFHYCMALNAMGEYLYREGMFAEAEAMLDQAIALLDKLMGKTKDMEILEANRNKIRRARERA